MSPQPLSPLNCRDLFDCDGVIWKGDELIDGVPQTLEMLRAKGKKLVFVTNNSLKSRSQYAEKFRSLGISVSQDEIFSSSFAAAMYLKVYVIGGEGILEELRLAGIAAFGGPKSWISGAGCMVAAICGSTQKEPVVAGKPSTFMMEFLLKKFNVSCSKMCTVGDRLDTDVLFGQNAGCKTLLVLSGCTTQSALQDPSNNIQPDYYTSKISDMLDLSGA
ncbi:hypothetical protein JHK84_042358 [Glycine max]|nr:hypothetical protein JHK84_042358 [Glycine max]